MTSDRCPSCGLQLGDVRSTRYKGNLTVIRYTRPEDGEDPDELEHVCGDQNLV